MIVLMQYYPRCYSTIGFNMRPKILVNKPHGNILIARNILPDLRNTQATLIIRPLFTVDLLNMSIDEYLLYTWLVREFAFFIRFQVIEDLLAVHNKNPDILVYLWSGQTYSVTGIHGFPHIGYELVKLGKISIDILGQFS